MKTLPAQVVINAKGEIGIVVNSGQVLILTPDNAAQLAALLFAAVRVVDGEAK